MCFMTQDMPYLVENPIDAWQESVLCCGRESYNYPLDSGRVMSGELAGDTNDKLTILWYFQF